ncbi:MAG: GIY-YIG nuclease family protein [Candidatus Omnitrophica bacterium]|nr:GIY-YIG nuclease family protein [Candidatus Omnitrophota bacterium]
MSNLGALKDKIAELPDSAGVYIFKDSQGEIIYIGKAKSLKSRVSSYLGRDLSSKTVALMSNVSDMEYRLTPGESLALLLEASLVHQYQPKYNVSLRDDKSFPSVKITHEEFPAVYITRKKEADGAGYLGPYTDVKLLRQALKIIRRSFPFRSCRSLPREACLYYRLKLCPAPCVAKINREGYAKIIENISLVLKGKTADLIKRLSEELVLRSKVQAFEEAAKIRDQIYALGSIGQSQTGFSSQFELEDLKTFLKLKQLPERIEAFDISNIYGKEATGSMVSFYRALPDKDNYRRFRIKTVSAIDDYKMLGEVIQRRYSRAIKEKLPLPDLVLIDGGRGHLLTTQKKLKELGIKIPLAGIAKKKENIYILGKPGPLRFKSDTPALNLIRRIRDEAHRFAVAYHHILRRKKIIGR